ncbi:EAL domain-containing protein [Psychromonas sp. MME2]|uniref:EAL domain-containing protein n=1 Tax=unclassified Psychromonas TaxID=2614957 RepID=UPI00339C2437
MADKIPFFQWRCDLSTGKLTCDAQLLDFLGYDKKVQLTLDSICKSFGEKQTIELQQQIKNTLVSQQSSTNTFLSTLLNDEYLIEFYVNFEDKKQANLALVGHIKLLKKYAYAAQINEALILTFTHSQKALMLADADHYIIKVNDAYCSETGYLEHELLGKHARLLKPGHYGADFYRKIWSKVDECKVWRGEILAKNKQAEIYTHDIILRRLDLNSGEHFYFVESTKLDVSTDIFTGSDLNDSKLYIPDKITFTKELENAYSCLSPNKTIVFVAFTAQSLQKINSSLIQWLIMQRFNIAGQHGHLGLISHSIFGAYWVMNKDADKINLLLQKVKNTLEAMGDDQSLSSININLHINMGASILFADANSHGQLMTHSMQTLIANPRNNEGAIYYFDRLFTKRFDKKQVLAKLLKAALINDQIEVNYQPIIDMNSMRINKFEALLRIKLDTALSYTTQELINIAEEHDWVDEIDRKVTRKALKALPLLQKHFQCEEIGMAINRSLANDRVSKCCLEETIEILQHSGADLSKVTIELTESAFFDNIERQKIWVEKLQKQGVQVALDDFGTGYSAFSYLKNLSVNILKIDKSFITGLTTDSNEYTMIVMLTKLAHQMGVKVVAEGVENIDEFKLLSRIKVDLIQGYLINKAQSLEKILSSSSNPVRQELFSLVYQRPLITVSRIMNSQYGRISPDQRLFDAKRLFSGQIDNYILVMNEGQCIGILRSKDMFAALSPYLDTEGEQKRDLLTLEKRVHQVMNRAFSRLTLTSHVADLDEIFLQDPEAIVVVQNEQSTGCLGVVTIHELLKYKLIEQDNDVSDE